MVISDVYYRARKMGLRAYHACLQAHKQPYLPVLDELVPEEKALARVPLGIVQIPLNRVVGTATRARSNAFAPNFMPLLEPNSEFAIKWVNLYESVLADGMRQPITVLEYMNEYYLVEGNKRVSVMKYLDSVFVEAEVTRVLPKRTRENRAYFEFIDFEKDSGLNAIIFTQPDKYNELIEKTGHTPGVKWSSEDRMDLRSAYLYFGNEYKAEYGDNPPIPVADAFLLYLNVFSYEEQVLRRNRRRHSPPEGRLRARREVRGRKPYHGSHRGAQRRPFQRAVPPVQGEGGVHLSPAH